MREAETLPPLLVVPETMTVEPTEMSLSEPFTLLLTVVLGERSTTCELPSRVLMVMLVASFAATVPERKPPAPPLRIPPKAPAAAPEKLPRIFCAVIVGRSVFAPIYPTPTPMISATTAMLIEFLFIVF